MHRWAGEARFHRYDVTNLVPEIEQLNELATAGLVPDLVVVLDLAADVARRRLLEVRGADGDPDGRDRLEREDDAFALAVHEAYRDLARTRGWALVDAGGDIDDVEQAVWDVVEERLLSDESAP